MRKRVKGGTASLNYSQYIEKSNVQLNTMISSLPSNPFKAFYILVLFTYILKHCVVKKVSFSE
jgi:hypothetical protein